MYNKIFLLLLCIAVAASACRKTEYPTIADPAYLRVFNDLDYNITLDNKDAPLPFLTFLLDPKMDADSTPVSALITGDFLDKRATWARPYPDAANTTLFQTEYPGSAKVLAGPVLNGYDLSSWAQIPSGKHRIVFMSRPLSNIPFYSLSKDLRSVVLIDTVIDFSAHEVYTMEVLERDAVTKTPTIYLRNENFVKQPFSDSAVYVNFYNLSSEGFFEKGVLTNSVLFNQKIRDTMTVFYTLQNLDDANSVARPVNGYTGVLMGLVVRSHAPQVNPYYSFPLFPDTIANKIYTGHTQQRFTFLAPGYTPANNPFLQYVGESNGRFSELAVGPTILRDNDFTFKVAADLLSGMAVTIRSGKYLNRSFATVNTIEYVNGKFYLMTIQRKYDPPIYE